VKGSPARLVIALSVAGVLAVFILYTAVVGGATVQLSPSTVAGHTGTVGLVGQVVGPVTGDAHAAGGLRFRLRDDGGKSTMLLPIVFHGSVPDLFRTGRHVVLTGRLRDGTFVGDSLITKCPSKFTDKPPAPA
jgi:cytochrome c-type biogenesis protein CcmE